MASRRTRKKHALHPVFWIALMIVVAIVVSRHLVTSEAVLIGAAGGVIVGGALGYRRGKANGTVIQAPSKTRKAAAPAPKARKPSRVTYKNHDPNALLAEMANWSSDCLDGRCGECSGTFEGRPCTHCNHPGARKARGTDLDLEVNDTPPF